MSGSKEYFPTDFEALLGKADDKVPGRLYSVELRSDRSDATICCVTANYTDLSDGQHAIVNGLKWTYKIAE